MRLTTLHSKQYCGFAEVQGYDPHMTTHFPGEDQPYQGQVTHRATLAYMGDTDEGRSFILRWVYCKFVSFDEIRKVDLTHQGDSVTQMWNGMQWVIARYLAAKQNS